MADIMSLRRDRAAAWAAAEALPHDSDELEAALQRVEAMDAQIATEERRTRLRASAAIVAPPVAAEDIIARMPEPRRALLSQHASLPPRERAQLLGFAERPFATFGEQLLAVQRLAVAHERDPRLVAAASGSNESVPAEGGYLVQTDFNAEILRRTFDTAQLATRVRRLPISANSNGLKINALKDESRATGSRWGGVQAYWTAEAGTIQNGGKPQFRQMELNLKKLAAVVYATDEMLADSTALESVLMQAVPAELAFLVDDAIIWGNGAGKPLGFMNSGAKITVAKEAGQAAKTITFENVTKMWARLQARSWSSANWYINQDVMPQLMTLHQVIGTGGVPVYLPPGGLSQSPYGTLLGRPVMPIEYASTLGTAGDIILADLGGYLMIDKGGVQAATSIHVQFLAGEQVFRFQYRVDGQPVDAAPVVPYKGSATQSAFVVLADRA